MYPEIKNIVSYSKTYCKHKEPKTLIYIWIMFPVKMRLLYKS